MELITSISEIPRVGPVYQKRLKKLGIKTVRDLLFHFPYRYEDFSHITPIAKAIAGQNVCVQGKILEIKSIRTFKRRMFLTKAIIADKTGAIKVTWFNQPYLTQTLKTEDNVCLVGRIVSGENETYLANPAYEKLSPEKETDLIHTGRIVPIYPETSGLSSRWLRSVIKGLLSKLSYTIPELLPPEIIRENRLLPIRKAIWQIHFPDSIALAKEAEKRFSFEELFQISLLVLTERRRINRERSIPVPINIELIQRFVKSLPFKLTDAQRKSAWRILKDLEKPRPMNRLLQGDVGSGKTVVAMMAILNTVKAKHQATVMAPTEILAKQHFNHFIQILRDFNLNIGFLTGKEDRFFSKKLKNDTIEISRKKLLEKAANSDLDILIGTHALIQKGVRFGNLALVVLDEQHRFGVEQRAKLCKDSSIKGKRVVPHLLSMTATPIPRTLALTIYGDLDLSLIDELPRGRKKIITEVVRPAERKKVYNFIRKEIKKGRQAFVICPRIEGKKKGEKTIGGFIAPEADTGPEMDTGPEEENYSKEISPWAEAKAVKEEFEKLSKEIFPDLKVGMLHGKIATKEKGRIMRDFRMKKIDILVSTSVIEVGIDVPNATVMMIEGAERFGLAQLHQFRGRVGRAKYQSYCFLFTDSPARKTHRRLKALLTCENGFKLAEKDLEIRGPGDFFGQRQWGIPDLVMSSLKDISLVEKARQTAEEFLEKDSELKKYPLLKRRIEDFRETIHLE